MSSSPEIGRGIAERFAAAGAAVTVHYRSGKAEAEAIATSLERARAVGGDRCDPNAVEQLFGEVVNELGPVDVLVNNAGNYPMHSILDAPADEWQEVVDANLRTTHLCTQAAARSMKERDTGGAIVNVASIEGLRPAPLHSHYNAAKGGVLMYTQSAAFELGAYGIRVNAVSPGLIWREGIEQAWPEGVERFGERAPLKRLGAPPRGHRGRIPVPRQQRRQVDHRCQPRRRRRRPHRHSVLKLRASGCRGNYTAMHGLNLSRRGPL